MNFMKSRAIVLGAILAGLLLIPACSEAGIVRRLLARRAAPRVAAFNVAVNVGHANAAVAARRGAALRHAFGVRRGFNGPRRGRRAVATPSGS